MANNSPSANYTTALNELTKEYIVYDGSDRETDVYVAATDAAHGSPCLRIQIEYDGASRRPTKVKESNSTWDSSWDI